MEGVIQQGLGGTVGASDSSGNDINPSSAVVDSLQRSLQDSHWTCSYKDHDGNDRGGTYHFNNENQ